MEDEIQDIDPELVDDREADDGEDLGEFEQAEYDPAPFFNGLDEGDVD